MLKITTSETTPSLRSSRDDKPGSHGSAVHTLAPVQATIVNNDNDLPTERNPLAVDARIVPDTDPKKTCSLRKCVAIALGGIALFVAGAFARSLLIGHEPTEELISDDSTQLSRDVPSNISDIHPNITTTISDISPDIHPPETHVPLPNHEAPCPPNFRLDSCDHLGDYNLYSVIWACSSAHHVIRDVVWDDVLLVLPKSDNGLCVATQLSVINAFSRYHCDIHRTLNFMDAFFREACPDGYNTTEFYNFNPPHVIGG